MSISDDDVRRLAGVARRLGGGAERSLEQQQAIVEIKRLLQVLQPD